MNRPMVIGHRGALHYCPENTLPSFKKALELDADGIELDVQLSADDEVVVIHDENVDRTTEGETGHVRNFSFAQLKRMDFGGWFNRTFAGERIPTLVDVIELIKEHCGGDLNAIHLDIELKTGIVPYPGLERMVVELLHSYDYQNVQICSFFHESLVEVRRIDKEIPTGVLYMSGLYEPWIYAARLGANSLNPYFVALSKEAVGQLPSHERHLAAARKAHMKYFPWTVDSEANMRAMLEQGVDGILTNRVDAAVSVRNEIAAQ